MMMDSLGEVEKSVVFPAIISNCIISVPLGEFGEPNVGRFLYRLRYWTPLKLRSYTTIDILSWGSVDYDGRGNLVYGKPKKEPFTYSHIRTKWLVLKAVGVEGEDKEGEKIAPMQVYAIYNVGLEGWNVLTADEHTLFHILQKNNMRTEWLPKETKECRDECARRCDVLIPRINYMRSITEPLDIRECVRVLIPKGLVHHSILNLNAQEQDCSSHINPLTYPRLDGYDTGSRDALKE